MKRRIRGTKTRGATAGPCASRSRRRAREATGSRRRSSANPRAWTRPSQPRRCILFGAPGASPDRRCPPSGPASTTARARPSPRTPRCPSGPGDRASTCRRRAGRDLQVGRTPKPATPSCPTSRRRLSGDSSRVARGRSPARRARWPSACGRVARRSGSRRGAWARWVTRDPARRGRCRVGSLACFLRCCCTGAPPPAARSGRRDSPG
mmetsp:Transcript_10912/g.45459  ORF Transcript_10912/g.45459 Transcript_10912/m.45459 type:complete len:208 (+) Transcript_10912:2615-3238(+)